jgi:fermentation-respiration switch protein FrsA (DUF1100 family)
VLIAVGTADDVTIPAFAQALYQKANQPKLLYLAPGAGHMDVYLRGMSTVRFML